VVVLVREPLFPSSPILMTNVIVFELRGNDLTAVG
jgi:hypothetical protein